MTLLHALVDVAGACTLGVLAGMVVYVGLTHLRMALFDRGNRRSR